jgi:hypothetical protein
MRTIGLFAATLLCATTVLADTPQYRVHWTFTSLNIDKNVIEDYSTNLDIPIAATLSPAAVKANWACVRRPVIPSRGDIETGTIECRNGTQEYIIQATCSMVKPDAMARAQVVFLPGGMIEFQVMCETKPQ